MPDFRTSPSEMNQSMLNKARADKFLLVLTVPKILKEIESSTRRNTKIDFDTIQYSIYGTVVPDVAVPGIELPYAGQVLKATSHTRPAYSNISVDFIIDNKFNNWWVIWKWLHFLNDPKTGISNIDQYRGKSTSSEDMGNYMTNITIYGLDEYENKVVQFNYSHVFPVSLGGIEYNYRSGPEIECSFEFAFHQFDVKLL